MSISTRVPNLADMLALHARMRGGQVAIEQGQQALTYAQLEDAVGRRAAHLAALGVARDDVVGVALRDTIEHVVVLYAVARLGAVVLPLDCRWLESEKQRVAAHFGAACVLVEPQAELPGVRCIAVDADWQAGVAGAAPMAPAADGDRGLVMSLSSGTTGRPKGPLLSHGGMLQRFVTHWAELGFGTQSVYVNATPLYFGGGRAFSLSTLYAGGRLVLFAPPYEPAELAAEVGRRQATATFLVPTLLRRLLACDDATLAPLRSLRTLISSGSALTPEERLAIRTRLCEGFLEYYSSTEGGGVSVLHPRDQQVRTDSVGRAVFGVEMQVVDEDHRALPVGEVGRIRYRGPGMVPGFYNDAAASDDAFRDGWFYPGDLGALDDAGYLFLKGRLKDMIIRGGVNIYPQEVEALLLAQPGVADAAVVGWPSREFNEEVAAFVVAEGELDVSALMAVCRRELARYKVPREVFVVDALPRNSGGKIRKPDLVARLPALG